MKEMEKRTRNTRKPPKYKNFQLCLLSSHDGYPPPPIYFAIYLCSRRYPSLRKILLRAAHKSTHHIQKQQIHGAYLLRHRDKRTDGGRAGGRYTAFLARLSGFIGVRPSRH